MHFRFSMLLSVVIFKFQLENVTLMFFFIIKYKAQMSYIYMRYLKILPISEKQNFKKFWNLCICYAMALKCFDIEIIKYLQTSNSLTFYDRDSELNLSPL